MKFRTTAGFLLVEVLVVILIVGITLSLFVVSIRPRANQDTQTACTNVLKSLMAATTAYANDNGGQLPHGMNNPWVKNDFFGTSYYAQSSLAPAQVCGIGLLMEGNYVPEKRESFSCPQTDAREDKGYNDGTWMPIVNFSSKSPNDASDRSLVQGLDKTSPIYYRNIRKATQNYALISTYAIRGPSLKLDALTKQISGKCSSNPMS